MEFEILINLMANNTLFWQDQKGKESEEFLAGKFKYLKKFRNSLRVYLLIYP